MIVTIIRARVLPPRLEIVPTKEVKLIVPSRTPTMELTLLTLRAREVGSHFNDRQKKYEGYFQKKGGITLWEQRSNPEEVLLFTWMAGVMVISKRPFDKRKIQHASFAKQ